MVTLRLTSFEVIGEFDWLFVLFFICVLFWKGIIHSFSVKLRYTVIHIKSLKLGRMDFHQ